MIENINTSSDNERSIFPLTDTSDTLSALNCSKFYLYKLIRKNIIQRYYIEFDNDGKPKGKPYFNLREIAEKFTKVSY
jgi:hypothetical protein